MVVWRDLLIIYTHRYHSGGLTKMNIFHSKLHMHRQISEDAAMKKDDIDIVSRDYLSSISKKVVFLGHALNPTLFQLLDTYSLGSEVW